MKRACGNLKAITTLPSQCIADLGWWVENIELVHKNISLPTAQVMLESDASNIGWGGCLITSTGKQTTGGHWDSEENELHINRKELLAAWLTIKCFCTGMRNVHIHLSCDNTTAIAYINNQGGT